MTSTQTTGVVGGVAVPDIRTQLFVDGEWRDASDGATFDVVAPASEEHLATVAAASEDDVDAAVRAARRQSDGGAWSRLTGAERGVLLYRLADLVERDLETFVTLEALDVGRPAFEPRLVDIPNVTGGRRPDRKGYFVEPAVFSGGGNDIAIARDEIFG